MTNKKTNTVRTSKPTGLLSEEIKIERGIPVPVFGGRGNRKYPFPQMKVGDSLYLHGDAGDRMYRAARVHATRNSWKIARRTIDGGVRVWRVK